MKLDKISAPRHHSENLLNRRFALPPASESVSPPTEFFSNLLARLALVSCLRKFATKFNRHSGQAGDSWRDPKSRNFKDFWMPVFTGMAVRVVVHFVN
jgi:hypothetical protein